MNRRAIVSVVGDAGVEPGSAAYDVAREIGRRLVDAGFRVMTGGVGGVMEAASRGAHESEAYREGDTIGLLPQADPHTANAWVDIPIATGLDFARNAIVGNADAVIAVGGGAGTLSEIAFGWMRRRLVIALELPGWSGDLGEKRLDQRVRLAEVPDDRIFAAATPEAAVAIVISRLPSYRAARGGFGQG
jgi:uncharacterized protein (TIGR00725 family)